MGTMGETGAQDAGGSKEPVFEETLLMQTGAGSTGNQYFNSSPANLLIWGRAVHASGRGLVTDTGNGIWSTANASAIFIPPGVSRVSFALQGLLSVTAQGTYARILLKSDGAATSHAQYQASAVSRMPTSSTGARHILLDCQKIPVTEGDYLSFRLHTSGPSNSAYLSAGWDGMSYAPETKIHVRMYS